MAVLVKRASLRPSEGSFLSSGMIILVIVVAVFFLLSRNR